MIVKVGFLSLILVAAGSVIPVAAQAVTEHYQLDIPRQQLDAALKDLAQQTGLQIARFSDTPGGSAFVGPVKGDMPVTDALRTLLAPGKLTYKMVNDHTIAVMTLSAAVAQTDSSTASGTTESSAGNSKQQEGKKSVGDSFRLAQANQGTPQRSTAVATDAQGSTLNSGSASLTEIVVTAQKKGEERLADVPIPISVLDAQALVDSNQLLMSDWTTNVPGLNFAAADRLQQFTIRGISSGYYTNPTVGVTIDDVPFTGSTNTTSQYQPDIDPGSLDSIEVLRGPQGTLYGASSMGGLVRYVTKDPSTDDPFSGNVQAGTSTVYNGAEAGFNFRGGFNFAIGDQLAVRMSGFTREDPGYVDNVLSGVNGVNELHSAGGLITALWRPSEIVSLKVNTLLQALTADGSPDVERPVNGYSGPPLGDLQQYYFPGLGGYTDKVQFYSAVLRVNLGGVEIASITGYSHRTSSWSEDNTYGLGAYFAEFSGVPGVGAAVVTNVELKKLSQELHATIPLGQRIEWLVGGFYTYERYPISQYGNAVAPGTGALVANEYGAYDAGMPQFAEYAAFTDLTYKVTDRFDIQLGGRESRITNYQDAFTTTGPLFGLSGGATSTSAAYSGPSSDAFTFLVTPRLKLSPDSMVYVRVASGYQAGGVINSGYTRGEPLFDPNEPTKYNSSKLVNSEVGVKSDFLSHTLAFEGSLYYIDWRDIQLETHDPINFASYLFNGGKAKSEGIELSVRATPTRGLKLSAWTSFDNAVLTQDFPAATAVMGLAGDRLPLSSRFSANASADQEFPIEGDFSGFAGASASYVGDRYGNFESTAERQVYPSYTRVDLRAGIKRSSWTAEFYAKNVGNTRGVIGGGLGEVPPFAFDYITPRTVGVNVSTKF
jgi:iron complex outermembrane recepter protein